MDRTQIKSSLDHIFDYGDPKELSRNLEVLRDYFSYLAETLEVDSAAPEIDRELSSYFDSSILLLRRQASYFSTEHTEQIEKILADSNCQEVIALASNLPPRKMLLILRAQDIAFAFFRAAFAKFSGLDPTIDPAILNRATLFRSKVALKRLAEITRYLRMIQPERADESFRDLAAHFDLDLVNKERLLVIVHELQGHVAQVTDPLIRIQIEHRVEKIESELRKKAPNWLAIIGGIFAVVGFVSDVKSLAPSIYGPLLERANHIVEVILSEGRVATRHLPMPVYPALPNGHPIKQDQFALPPQDDEETGDTRTRTSTETQ